MAKQGAIRALITISLFVILEGGSLFMVANSSVFQRVKVSITIFKFSSGIQRIETNIRYFFNLRRVNEMYRQENLRLTQELSRYKHAMREFIPEGEYVPADSSGNFLFIPATVIINSTNQLRNYIFIDKGRGDGIEIDMGVISVRGVVGMVSSVSEHYACIISLLNINWGVFAKVLPSDAFGTLTWDGKNIRKALLNEIPIHVPITEGDTIYTSGYASIFPADIPLGTVNQFSAVKGAHYQIEANLFQDFSTLRYVTVVKNREKEEIYSIVKGNE